MDHYSDSSQERQTLNAFSYGSWIITGSVGGSAAGGFFGLIPAIIGGIIGGFYGWYSKRDQLQKDEKRKFDKSPEMVTK